MKTKPHFTPTVLGFPLSALMATTALAQEPLDRSVLPVPEPKRAPMTELDVRIRRRPLEVKAPKAADR
jgi:hypothetical protein